jgi:hypothetical protein
MSAGHSSSRSVHEQRRRNDRRSRLWWSLWYGNFKPRRRSDARRHGEPRFHWLDWHSPHLLAVAIGIALLSVADACLTLGLLQGGAQEANPLMAALLYRSVAAFAALKMLLTGFGVVLMVVLARYRFMRVLPVAWVLYGVLVSYAGLIGYELWMKNGLGGGAIL